MLSMFVIVGENLVPTNLWTQTFIVDLSTEINHFLI